MGNEARLIAAYGENEAGLADVPRKVSGTFVSRILHGEEMGCSYCFPHGIETSNSRFRKRQRSWKIQRKTKWRP